MKKKQTQRVAGGENCRKPQLWLVLLALGLGLAGTGILAGALYLAG